MAGTPTDAEIRAWFGGADAVVVFASLVVPVIAALIAAALRFTLHIRPVRWLIAGLCWLVFFFAFSGTGWREIAGARWRS